MSSKDESGHSKEVVSSEGNVADILEVERDNLETTWVCVIPIGYGFTYLIMPLDKSISPYALTDAFHDKPEDAYREARRRYFNAHFVSETELRLEAFRRQSEGS